MRCHQHACDGAHISFLTLGYPWNVAFLPLCGINWVHWKSLQMARMKPRHGEEVREDPAPHLGRGQRSRGLGTPQERKGQFQPSSCVFQGSSLLCMPNVLKLYLENGQTKAFKFEANTTVKVLRVNWSLFSGANLAPKTPRHLALQLPWGSYNH